MARQTKKSIKTEGADTRTKVGRETKDELTKQNPEEKKAAEEKQEPESAAVDKEEPIELSEEAKIILARSGAYYEGRYYYGLGRRKTSVAQVKLFTKGKDKKFLVNGKDYKNYFKLPRLIYEVEKPLLAMKAVDKFGIKVRVGGGGIGGQAGAVRLGITRALIEFNADFRKRLRRRGFLTRDARMVERKKYGKRKARRSHQWSKR